jgi:hypothetical protein
VEQTFKKGMGDWFHQDYGGVYILVSMGDRKMALINCISGNRYSDTIPVADLRDVNDTEFSRMCGGEERRFHRITKPMEIVKYNNLEV